MELNKTYMISLPDLTFNNTYQAKKFKLNPDVEFVKNLDAYDKYFETEEATLDKTIYDHPNLNTTLSASILKLKFKDIKENPQSLKAMEQAKAYDKKEELKKEIVLEKHKEYLQKKIQKNKSEKVRVTKLICEIQAEILKMLVDIDFMKNFVSFSQTKELTEFFTIQKTKADHETQTKKQQEYKHNNLRRESQINEKENEIAKKEKEKSNYKKQKNKIEIEIQNDKAELHSVRNKLYYYYLNLLKTGLDVREEGLSWIIKKIWRLDFEISITNFPDFLDEKCIMFLNKKARGELELEKLKLKKQGEYVRKLTLQSNEENYSYSLLNFLQPPQRAWFGNFSRHNTKTYEMKKKNSLSSENVVEELAKQNQSLKIKNIQPFLEVKITREENKMLIDAEEIEAHYWELKDELNTKFYEELQRLDKEFTFNNYQRRFNANRSIVASALIGKGKAIDEFIKSNKKLSKLVEKGNRNKSM